MHLTTKDVAKIKKLFPAKNAADERRRIALAIGEWEKIIGTRNGTWRDLGNTFSAGDMFQQDCIDESTNTTVYLTLMQNMGWFKYNSVAGDKRGEHLPAWDSNWEVPRSDQTDHADRLTDSHCKLVRQF